MTTVEVVDDRQQFDIIFLSEAQAIDTLSGLVVKRHFRRVWTSWCFDRSIDGRLAARFVASPGGVRSIRRQIAQSAADVVVSLPRAVNESKDSDKLTELLEQAASDFVLYVVSCIPEGDHRRAVIRTISDQLLRRCTGLYGGVTHAEELTACFRRLGPEPAIAGSLGAYLHVCSEAVAVMRRHLGATELVSLIDAHASANERRWGVA